MNPKIVWNSTETFTMWDDCMSFPTLLVRLQRFKSISVHFSDEHGKPQEWSRLNQATSELLQHEIDHLHGKLFLDYLSVLKRRAALAKWGKEKNKYPAFIRRLEPYARIQRFRHAGDAAQSWPNHVIRDAEYMNWRYIESPRDYVALASGGSYAVLGHKEHRGTAVAYVADLVGPPKPLLRACLAEVRRGSRALVAIPAPEHRAAYASLGFFPTRTTLHLMGKALAGELETDRRAWRFTLGDTDFF